MRVSLFAAALATLCSGAFAAIDTIEVKDRHFVNSRTGKPFWVKGVDYQPGGSAKFKKGSDPLSNPDVCARDIYLLQQLGVNTIRVYSIDPDINHDKCMTLLAEAGIYLVLDVNTPLAEEHLNNQLPWTTYTENYLEHIFKVADVFAGYPNTLAYLAGNEVIFDDGSAKASPNYVKAVVRDLKAYMTNHVSRIIPVGYSNADDLKFRNSLAHYLECGDVGYIDFWGVNSYQWCGKNTFEGSGYDKLVEDYTSFSLPVFFTEYGCNKVAREWQEVSALYSDKMTSVFSGGLVYEYSQESNDYGLVDIKGKTVKTRKDYDKLKPAFAAANTDEVSIPSSTKNNPRPRTCPEETSSVFENITANLTLPYTLGADLIKNGVKVTRGKLVSGAPKKTTGYTITMAGSVVSDPTVEVLFEADNSPLAPGGHGKNVGGGNGEGAPSGSTDSDDSDSAAAFAAPISKAFVASLGLVALGFGIFL